MLLTRRWGFKMPLVRRFGFLVRLLFVTLQIFLAPCAVSLVVEPNGPIILATNVEYKELLDGFDCEATLLNTLNRYLDGRIQLRYYPGRRALMAGSTGEVHGIYYAPKDIRKQRIPNMVMIETSRIKEEILFYSNREIMKRGGYKGRPITFLPSYRWAGDKLASGYFAPSSVRAQSIRQMINLLAAGRVDGFFLLGLYQPLISKLYLETGRTELHTKVIKQGVSLYLHINKQHTELIKELELKFQKIQRDPLFKNQRLNKHC